MRIPFARRLRPVVVLAAVGAVLSGCVVNGADPEAMSGTSALSDINPQSRSALRDGGTLRIAMGGMPPNFNYLQVDGDNADTQAIVYATLPSCARVDDNGRVSVDHNYFTSATLTSTNPQVVVWTINPKAVWSDGTPITWEDLAAQWQALNNHNPLYQSAASQGFDKVTSVVEGVDDRQAVMTFAQPYNSWNGMYSPLYPKSVTESPDAFNTSIRDTLPITAGPFKVGAIDKVAKRITLVRNPLWWGDKPPLDQIVFSDYDEQDWVPGLANNEIDATDSGLRTVGEVRQARNLPDIVVRRSPDLYVAQITLNGASSAILSDQRLRLAIVKAIDRRVIAKALLFGLAPNPQPPGNHVFLTQQHGYRDNGGPFAADADAANRELDGLGWIRHGAWRSRNGRLLELHYETSQTPTGIETGEIIQQQLAAVGVKVDVHTSPGDDMFTRYLVPGNFDMAAFSWGYTAWPMQALDQIFKYNPAYPGSNYGHIGNPQINAQIAAAQTELDPDKAVDLANQVDSELFAEGFSILTYQLEGNYPTRSTVANYGSFGLATPDYTKIGFLK